MLNNCAVLLFIICCFHIQGRGTTNNGVLVEGHYWRDYPSSSLIPNDALPGGRNENGFTTYIGQVLHKEQLIPAKIDSQLDRISFEWGYKEYVVTRNIKILCTQHPEQFEWLTTGHTIFDQVREKNLVPGGYESGVTLFIGRKEINGSLEVGKIYPGKNQQTLNTVHNGEGIQHASFSVLAYNPNIKPVTKDKCDNSKPTPLDLDIDMRNGNSGKHPQGDSGETLVINIFNV